MTQKTGRKRGRPPGAGIDDAPILQKIAALMTADPTLRLTTAIKKSGVYDPTPISRLRRKWKKEGARLLAAAKEKARRAAAPARSGGSYSGSRAHADLERVLDRPSLAGLNLARTDPLREMIAAMSRPDPLAEARGALDEAIERLNQSGPVSPLLKSHDDMMSRVDAFKRRGDRLEDLTADSERTWRLMGF